MCAVFTMLPHGVMVAPQILNLLVMVRVHMRQPLESALSISSDIGLYAPISFFPQIPPHLIENMRLRIRFA